MELPLDATVLRVAAGDKTFLVPFPYARPLAAQQSVVRRAVATLSNGGHALLESPTGTGKTLALLSAILSYQHGDYAERYLVWHAARLAKARGDLEAALAAEAAAGRAAEAVVKAAAAVAGRAASKAGAQGGAAQEELTDVVMMGRDPPPPPGPARTLALARAIWAAQAVGSVPPKVRPALYSSRTHSQLSQVSSELRKVEFFTHGAGWAAQAVADLQKLHGRACTCAACGAAARGGKAGPPSAPSSTAYDDAVAEATGACWMRHCLDGLAAPERPYIDWSPRGKNPWMSGDLADLNPWLLLAAPYVLTPAQKVAAGWASGTAMEPPPRAMSRLHPQLRVWPQFVMNVLGSRSQMCIHPSVNPELASSVAPPQRTGMGYGAFLPNLRRREEVALAYAKWGPHAPAEGTTHEPSRLAALAQGTGAVSVDDACRVAVSLGLCGGNGKGALPALVSALNSSPVWNVTDAARLGAGGALVVPRPRPQDIEDLGSALRRMGLGRALPGAVDRRGEGMVTARERVSGARNAPTIKIRCPYFATRTIQAGEEAGAGGKGGAAARGGGEEEAGGAPPPPTGVTLTLIPYNYIVEKALRGSMNLDLRGAIIVVDEGHNLEDAAREAASGEWSLLDLQEASAAFERVEKKHHGDREIEAPHATLRRVLRRLLEWANDLCGVLKYPVGELKACSVEEGGRGGAGTLHATWGAARAGGEADGGGGMDTGGGFFVPPAAYEGRPGAGAAGAIKAAHGSVNPGEISPSLPYPLLFPDGPAIKDFPPRQRYWEGNAIISFLARAGISVATIASLMDAMGAVDEHTRKVNEEQAREAAAAAAGGASGAGEEEAGGGGPTSSIAVTNAALAVIKSVIDVACLLLIPRKGKSGMPGDEPPPPGTFKRLMLDRVAGEAGNYASDYRLCIKPHEPKPGAFGTAAGGPPTELLHRLCLWCLSAEPAFRDTADQAHSVLVTSGTLAPLPGMRAALGVPFFTELEAPHAINAEAQVWSGVISAGVGPTSLVLAHTTVDGAALPRLRTEGSVAVRGGSSPWPWSLVDRPSLDSVSRGALMARAPVHPSALAQVDITPRGWDGERSSTRMNGTYAAVQDAGNREKYLDAIGVAVLAACTRTPGGVLVFFPSYGLLESALTRWKEPGCTLMLADDAGSAGRAGERDGAGLPVGEGGGAAAAPDGSVRLGKQVRLWDALGMVKEPFVERSKDGEKKEREKAGGGGGGRGRGRGASKAGGGRVGWANSGLHGTRAPAARAAAAQDSSDGEEEEGGAARGSPGPGAPGEEPRDFGALLEAFKHRIDAHATAPGHDLGAAQASALRKRLVEWAAVRAEAASPLLSQAGAGGGGSAMDTSAECLSKRPTGGGAAGANEGGSAGAEGGPATGGGEGEGAAHPRSAGAGSKRERSPPEGASAAPRGREVTAPVVSARQVRAGRSKSGKRGKGAAPEAAAAPASRRLSVADAIHKAAAEQVAEAARRVVRPRLPLPSEVEAQVGNADLRTGAVFFGVSRARAAEGLDFANDRARAVLCVGIPFPALTDPLILLKRRYQDDRVGMEREALRQASDRGDAVPVQIDGAAYYNALAFKALNQSVGRVIRHRHDYGAILLLDERLGAPATAAGLPRWLKPSIRTGPGARAGLVDAGGAQLGLTTGAAGGAGAAAFKTPPQPGVPLSEVVGNLGAFFRHLDWHPPGSDPEGGKAFPPVPGCACPCPQCAARGCASAPLDVSALRVPLVRGSGQLRTGSGIEARPTPERFALNARPFSVPQPVAVQLELTPAGGTVNTGAARVATEAAAPPAGVDTAAAASANTSFRSASQRAGACPHRSPCPSSLVCRMRGEGDSEEEDEEEEEGDEGGEGATEPGAPARGPGLSALLARSDTPDPQNEGGSEDEEEISF